MKQYRWLTALVVGAFLLAACGGMQAAVPDLALSEVVEVLEPTYTEDWDGRGSDSQKCEKGAIGDELRPLEAGWMHWIFATKGDSSDARLTLSYSGVEVDGSPFEPGPPLNANTWHFYTPFYDPADVEATIELFGGDPGRGGGLVLSDYCPGDGDLERYWDLSGKKIIEGLLADDPLLLGWPINVYDVEYDPVIEDFAFTLRASTATIVGGVWELFNLGPFAEGDLIDLAVCEDLTGYPDWFQVAPLFVDDGTTIIVDGRVCHRVTETVGKGDGSTADLDFENALRVTVEKTVDLEFTRTHDWRITKTVDPDTLYLYFDGTVKNGSLVEVQDEFNEAKVTWTITLDYLSFVDSAHKVSGMITIENPGGIPATIASVTDVLTMDDTPFSLTVVCKDRPSDPDDAVVVTFDPPYSLGAGAFLDCTYSDYPAAADVADGANTVTVVTGQGYSATDTQLVTWADADVTELHKDVEITDTNLKFADKYGDINDKVLRSAPLIPNPELFTYTDTFKFSIEDECKYVPVPNAATLISDDGFDPPKSDDALLELFFECREFNGETAWAANADEAGEFRFFRNGGNWATYVKYVDGKTSTLFAGQTMDVGSVKFESFDDMVKITIKLTGDWVIDPSDVFLAVKGWDVEPKNLRNSSAVAPGQFPYKEECEPEGDTCSIEVPAYNWYAVHVNVGYFDYYFPEKPASE